MKYEHPLKNEIKPFDEIKSEKLHSVILSEEYVDLSAGSGLVHCAPGCGPEDYEVGHREGLPPFNSISEIGIFPSSMGKFSGLTAKKDDKKFVDALRENNALISITAVEHEYAHCWRCHKPVVFRTTKQWFFRVEDMLEEMRELNKKVFWQPDWAGSNWFDSWLKNLRDNGITRQRYWGTPLPIWKCNKCDNYTVVGSIKELKKLADNVPDDLHKPYIDEVTIKCKCGGVQNRIPDILDVWIDAGTTSWACLDYPQREDLFKKLWPAEFILEGKDQIRGWFNLLLVASMVSMGKHSYKACYMHGFVQDATGRKMSKSLGNVISPYEVIDSYGADTLRHYMIGSTNPGLDINYNMEDAKIKNRNLNILWNLHKYLIDYSKDLGVNPSKIRAVDSSIEENYIISKLNSAIEKTTLLFNEYKLNEAPWAAEELFLDLSRTYIQLTRDKASIGSDDDKKAVLYTVFNVLLGCLKLFAPIAPFITEAIYQNLRKEFDLKEESIHLLGWPVSETKSVDKKLEENMGIISSIVQNALAAREKIQLGIRWPLKEIVVVSSDKKAVDAVEKLMPIIKLQLNVKDVIVKDQLEGVRSVVKADYRQIGPDFGNKAPKIIAKLSSESAETILRHIGKDGKYEIKIDSEKINIVKEHLIVTREVPYPYEEVSFKGGLLYLNKEMTDELEAEGFAREVMRRVQALRKKAELQKSDRISLFLKTDEELKEMLGKWEKQIKEKVGAEKIKIDSLGPAKKHNFSSKEKVKGKEIEIWFDKV